MSIAAFLPPQLVSHVRHFLPIDRELLVAESWQELESLIRRKPVSLVILDPAAEGDVNVSAVAGLMKRYPSLPLIAYVTLHAPQFSAVAQLGRLGLKEVVLHRFDDEPESFRQRVERLEGNALTHGVLEALRGRLGLLPRRLAVAIEDLFESPHRYASALDLANRTELAAVSVYRNLDGAQLGSPKRLVIAAKVLKGFGYLRDPGYSVLDVSMKLGYKAARIFAEHWELVFGKTPARVRNRLTDEAAIEGVLRWIGTGDGGTSMSGDSGNPPGHNGARRRRRRRTEPS